jgi:hypothetical protein
MSDPHPSLLAAVRGPLFSRAFAATQLWRQFAGALGETDRVAALGRLRRWWRRLEAEIGPASSVRGLFDRGAAPLGALLGYRPAPGRLLHPELFASTWRLRGGSSVPVLVAPYERPLDPLWRDAVRLGVALGAAWSVLFNGCQLRLLDTRRTYARRFLEFDLAAAALDEPAGALLWALLRAEALAPPRAGSSGSLLDAIVAASEAHRASVGADLGRSVPNALATLVDGVRRALDRRRPSPRSRVPLEAVFEQALTLVYRILFLLFAEARGLVPVWHPVYRDAYTIEALRQHVDEPAAGRGTWEALQAISRLAYRGCEAADLRVAPFNGRLFSPARAPLLDRLAVDDGVAREVLVALTTRRSAGGREAISYADLGVEQLGAVYERVLDLVPRIDNSGPRPRVRLDATGGRRKATGSFYTPRSMTEYLVRCTLHPLVDGASAEAILRLRVLDPAMGSGAFLVAACRYLAAAYEAALLREGAVGPSDLTEGDRVGFRRLVARRCLYGVDCNPTAVHLARLSLWLATLAADRPLGFLDHHLRVGDSLVGASLEDLARRPSPGPRGRRAAPAARPLFEEAAFDQAMAAALPSLVGLAERPDDRFETVREKERTLARLGAAGSPLARWKAVLDLWCAYWFWDPPADAPPPTAFADLAARLLGRPAGLPAPTAGPYLDRARRLARARRFFHWPLEFPDVFYQPDGRPRAAAGFDAVVGNPPWETLRADQGDPAARRHARADFRRLVEFAATSGVYRVRPEAHPNLYQLFVERALGLLRPGGRLGLVVPWGLATDRGAAALRRHLFDRAAIDALVSFENRDAIFPVHRGVRFLLLTATAGLPTTEMACRFGERDPAVLDSVPERRERSAFPVILTRALLERWSGADLAWPDLRTPRDLALVARLVARVPALGDPRGWGARFGRELNAAEDAAAFVPPGRGLPVVGGKQIAPFVVDVAAAPVAIPAAEAARRLDRAATFGRARVVYRDVAAPTNRLTLIAAIVPPDVVTTHTLFCLKTPLSLAAAYVLVALLNSYVANYLVRQRVTSHVTVAVVERLPVPRPGDGTPVFAELAALAARLAVRPPEASSLLARLQAQVARLYGLDLAEFDHVLASFPLVAADEKAAARAAFRALDANELVAE